MSDLDQEFEKTIREQIKVKLEAAASLIQEADRLSIQIEIKAEDDDPSGLLSYEFYNEVRPLIQALDAVGWSTSSMNC
jgi:hypothetical protein